MAELAPAALISLALLCGVLHALAVLALIAGPQVFAGSLGRARVAQGVLILAALCIGAGAGLAGGAPAMSHSGAVLAACGVAWALWEWSVRRRPEPDPKRAGAAGAVMGVVLSGLCLQALLAGRVSDPLSAPELSYALFLVSAAGLAPSFAQAFAGAVFTGPVPSPPSPDIRWGLLVYALALLAAPAPPGGSSGFAVMTAAGFFGLSGLFAVYVQPGHAAATVARLSGLLAFPFALIALALIPSGLAEGGPASPVAGAPASGFLLLAAACGISALATFAVRPGQAAAPVHPGGEAASLFRAGVILSGVFGCLCSLAGLAPAFGLAGPPWASAAPLAAGAPALSLLFYLARLGEEGAGRLEQAAVIISGLLAGALALAAGSSEAALAGAGAIIIAGSAGLLRRGLAHRRSGTYGRAAPGLALGLFALAGSFLAWPAAV